MKEHGLWKSIVSLSCITIVSGVILSVMNVFTAPSIAESAMRARNVAIAEVLPEFDNDPTEERVGICADGDSVWIYPASRVGDSIGMAVELYAHNAFGGDMTVLVGFDADGAIHDYRVLKHTETPGLGAKVSEWFRRGVDSAGVIGAEPLDESLKVAKDGGSIDGITAATITSRAFVDALNRAASIVAEYRGNKVEP